MSVSVTSRNPRQRDSTRTLAHPPVSCPTSNATQSRTGSRNSGISSTRKLSAGLDNTPIFMVPIYDDKQQGADLLIIPASNVRQQDRSETPARPPTPPPKPVIPRQCEDWDDFISWRKSEATCKVPMSEKPRLANSAKEDILRGFEEWKDYLSQIRIPGRKARPLSIMSTSTTGRSLARSSMCSMSSTSSSKARSLRRCSRSRHLRAYYSMGCLLRNKFSQRDNDSVSSPIANIMRTSVGRHSPALRRPFSQQSLPTNWTFSPPPHPPPNKPLPDLPASALKEEKRGRGRNRSVLEMKEKKKFQWMLWQ